MNRSIRYLAHCGTLIVMLAGTTIAWAQTSSSSSGASSSSRTSTNPAVRSGTLPNGLRYYIRHNTIPTKRAELRLVVDAGSILEDDDQRGLAHFVEHMAFNGTKRFPRRRLIEYIESVGVRFGADLNASTSYDETVYMLTVPTEPAVLDTALLILEDWAHNVTFDPREVEAERGVVMEERRMRAGPELRQYQRHAPVLLGSRYASRFPIGAGEILLHAPREAIVRYYKDWYRPNLMTVVIVGDIDPAVMEAKLVERFKSLTNPASPRPRPNVQVPSRISGAASIAEDPEITNWSASLVFPMPAIDTTLTETAFRRRTVSRLLYGVLNDRFGVFARSSSAPIRQASISRDVLGRDRPAHAIQLVAEEPTTLELGIVSVRAELSRLARSGVTAAEFERARTLLTETATAAKLTADQQSSPVLVERYVQSALQRKPMLERSIEADWLLRFVPQIQPADLQTLAAEIDSTRGWLILADVPKNSSHGKPSTTILLDAVRDGERHRLPAYRDTTVAGSLLAAEPARGHIVQQRVVPGLEVTEWILSNGARVVLKPTPWKKDELVVRAVAPGGISLASDAQYLAASVSSQLVSRSGFGTYDAKALTRRLAGVVGQWDVSVGDTSQAALVAGTPRHTKTLLQLLHLIFTAPRIDSEAFARWRRDARRGSLAPLELAIRRGVAQRHPRARPVVGVAADSVDSAAVLSFYRERFRDAGQYTFVIVGDFHPDSLRTLVEQYIGGLPGQAGGTPVRPRDLGIRPPAGIVRRVVVGDDSVATTHMRFYSEATSTPESRIAMKAVIAVLQERLMIRLREEMEGIYGVSVRGRSLTVPYGQRSLWLQFTSEPERAEELQRATLAVIDTLLERGVRKDELKAIQTILLRQHEVESQQNAYWVERFSEMVVDGRSLEELATEDRQLQTVTSEAIMEAMRLVLTRDRYLLAVSLPVRLAPVQRDELLSTQW